MGGIRGQGRGIEPHEVKIGGAGHLSSARNAEEVVFQVNLSEACRLEELGEFWLRETIKRPLEGEVMWPAPDQCWEDSQKVEAGRRTAGLGQWPHIWPWGINAQDLGFCGRGLRPSTAAQQAWAQDMDSVWVKLPPLHNACKCLLHMNDPLEMSKWSKHGKHFFVVGIKKKEKAWSKKTDVLLSHCLRPRPGYFLETSLTFNITYLTPQRQTGVRMNEGSFIVARSTHTKLTLMSILTWKHVFPKISDQNNMVITASFKRNSLRLKR